MLPYQAVFFFFSSRRRHTRYWRGSSDVCSSDLVAFAGVLLIGLATRGAEADGLGVVLCLVAAVTYAAGVVAQKPVLRRLPPLQVTATACAIGALCCLPWAGSLVAELGSAAPGSVVGLVYLGVVPTALAFSTWAYALARTDAGRLGVTTYLAPPLVVLMGWLLLDEGPPPLAVAGGAVCLVGVALSRRRPAVRRPGPGGSEEHTSELQSRQYLVCRLLLEK